MPKSSIIARRRMALATDSRQDEADAKEHVVSAAAVLRAPGSSRASVSRTYRAPMARTVEAITAAWIETSGVRPTVLATHRHVRATSPDGVRTDLRFNPRAPGRVQVVADTRGPLPPQAVRRIKAYWRAQFERVSRVLGN